MAWELQRIPMLMVTVAFLTAFYSLAFMLSFAAAWNPLHSFAGREMHGR